MPLAAAGVTLAMLLTSTSGHTEQGATPPSPIPFTRVVIDSTPPSDLHAKTVGDIDGDGFIDALAAGAVDGDGLFWYEYPTWSKHTIVPAGVAPFSTDLQVTDVDRDGDLDVVAPKRVLPRTVWWYENPGPAGDPAVDTWVEHEIGFASGHDLEVGDIDKDGWNDIVVREDSTKVFVQDGLGGWKGAVVSTRPDEGLALGDLDDDGDIDLAINGHWLENPLPAFDPTESAWTEHEIDDTWPTQVTMHVADVNADGRLDVVMAPAESGGRLAWYEATSGATGPWFEHVIDADVSFMHGLKTADMDIDGDLDVVAAEMEQSTDPDNVSVYLNLGGGLLWSRGDVDATGSHNIRLADFDADGDVDILGANWLGAKPLVMWRSGLDPALDLDAWQRHVVDASRPWRAVFVTAADLDGDNLDDIITGGWWYRNPGAANGAWARDTLGAPLRNMAVVSDFDRDGDLDVLGTRGVGAQANDSLVWARNDGAGAFSIVENVEPGVGDFLQGTVVAPFNGDGRPVVVLSWHDTSTSVQRLTVPSDPSAQPWAWDEIAALSQSEDLSGGDIDRDGDLDILQGTRWLRNDSLAWSQFTLSPAAEAPDRNRLADINRDGRLDAVVGFEAISTPGNLVWYEQGTVATDPWLEHVIATVTGPMSLDVADMDSDGDLDVVVGEHDLATPEGAGIHVFENADGQGNTWVQHTVHVGDEHHDGAQAVDIDNDGDLDIISIGWSHDRVLLYENRAVIAGGGGLFNDPPVAVLEVNPISGNVPLSVSLDASGSFDPDGDALTYVWSFGDGSPADSGVSVNHLYSFQGQFSVTVTVSDGQVSGVAGVTVNAGDVPGPLAGLIHHWWFDEGTGVSAGDSSGSASGTLENGAAWASAGRYGRAIRFDGVDDYVDVGPIDVVSDSGLTLALWFKADDFDVHDARFITKATGTATADHYWMLSTINGTALRFRLKAGGTTDLLATGTGEIEAGRWYHIAGTYDGSTMRIYKDGREVASMPKSGTLDTDSTVHAAIGNQPAGAGNLPFDGLIDDVRVYDRALTPAEIDSLITFTLNTNTEGSGSVIRHPDRFRYVIGDTVVLAAAPDEGWLFTGWSHGLSGTENPDTITVVGDTVVTAAFATLSYVVSTDTSGRGTVTLTPDRVTYGFGDTLIVGGDPDSGWVFAAWTVGLSGSENPETLVVTRDTSVAATFTPMVTVPTLGSAGIVAASLLMLGTGVRLLRRRRARPARL